LKNKTAYWISGIGCSAVFCCLLILVAWFYLSGTSEYFIDNKEELKNITIQQAFPSNVQSGETFTFEIQITNTSNEAQMLDSIDFFNKYLSGITINQSTPPFLYIRQSDSNFPFNSYQFNTEIPGNSTLVISFNMTAQQAGKYVGTDFICVNNPTLCNYYVIKTTVQ
jgi:hypothetical protein